MPEEKTPLPHEGDMKPVVWTPEDASRFLTAAIHEAQRPLADALKQRPITSKALTAVIALMAVATIVIAVILSNQLDKTEKAADDLRASHNSVLSEKIEYQTESKLLKERLDTTQAAMAAMRGSGDELRRTQTDLQRSRRQNELLRSQISGLEMEKMALARQLEAVKALALDDEDFSREAGSASPGTTDTQETGSPVSAAGEEPREDAAAAPQPGETFPGTGDAVIKAGGETQTPAAQPDGNESPEAAGAAGTAESAETEISEPQPAGEKADDRAVTESAAEANLPALYESSQIFESDGGNAAADAAASQAGAPAGEDKNLQAEVSAPGGESETEETEAGMTNTDEVTDDDSEAEIEEAIAALLESLDSDDLSETEQISETAAGSDESE